MDKQQDLMILLDQFFDRDLERVGAMLDQHREDGDHKVTLKILMDLRGKRGTAKSCRCYKKKRRYEGVVGGKNMETNPGAAIQFQCDDAFFSIVLWSVGKRGRLV
jgi:hypothetical protein